MMYAWRFGRKVDAQTVMLWLPTTKKYIADDGTDFDIGLLFDYFQLNSRDEFSDLRIMNGKTWLNHDLRVVKDVLSLDPARTPEETKEALYKHGDTFITDDLVGYRFDNESRWDMLSDLSRQFKSLPIEPSITKQLDAISSELSGEPYTIVHVRRGDVMRVLRSNLEAGCVGDDDLQQLLKRTAPVQHYLDIIEEHGVLKDSRVLVSSDDPTVAKKIQLRLGEDKCKRVSDFKFKGHKIQRDFFDFLIFVRAQRIIGTRGSVYGKYASIFGGSEFIDVVFDPTPSELENYFNLEVIAGLDIPMSLLNESRERLLQMRAQMVA